MISKREWELAKDFDLYNFLTPEFVIHVKLNLNEYGDKNK